MTDRIPEHSRDLMSRHPVVDIHSDYAIEIFRADERGEPDLFNATHLPALQKGHVNMEVLTVGGDFDIDGMPIWENRIVRGIIASTRRQIEAHPDCHLILRAADLESVRSRNGFGFMLALEGLRCVEDLAALEMYHAAGVRSVILTHNERNLAADGCGEPLPGGLSKFGRALLARMQSLHMVLDFVHLSDPSFFDAMEHWAAPPLVSHSNARALCDHRRNLTDEQIRMIAAREGVIGLNFLGLFIDADINRATPDRLVDHAIHIADIAGTHCLALGPDYADYYMDAMKRWLVRDNLPPNLMNFITGSESVSLLPVFIDTLLRRGFNDDDVTGILGANALRLYSAVLSP